MAIFNGAMSQFQTMLPRVLLPILITALPGSGCKNSSDSSNDGLAKANAIILPHAEEHTRIFLKTIDHYVEGTLIKALYECPSALYEDVFIKHNVNAPRIRARAFCCEQVGRLRLILDKMKEEGKVRGYVSSDPNKWLIEVDCRPSQ